MLGRTRYERRTGVVTLLCGVLGSLLLGGGTVEARKPSGELPFDVEVISGGRVLEQFGSGLSRHLRVPKVDEEYRLKIINRSHRRLEVVISVDGLSVMNGKPASQSTRGYLLPANDSIEIPGWRRGDAEVAAFTFTPRKESYAARTGRPQGVGVIQLSAYEERSLDPILRPQSARGGVDPAEFLDENEPIRRRGYQPLTRKSGGRAATKQDLGTGYGRELDHHVESVAFERAGSSPHKIAIHYGRQERVLPRKITRPVTQDNFTPPPPSR